MIPFQFINWFAILARKIKKKRKEKIAIYNFHAFIKKLHASKMNIFKLSFFPPKVFIFVMYNKIVKCKYFK